MNAPLDIGALVFIIFTCYVFVNARRLTPIVTSSGTFSLIVSWISNSRIFLKFYLFNFLSLVLLALAELHRINSGNYYVWLIFVLSSYSLLSYIYMLLTLQMQTDSSESKAAQNGCMALGFQLFIVPLLIYFLYQPLWQLIVVSFLGGLIALNTIMSVFDLKKLGDNE